MSWAKFDDAFPWHRKVRRLSDGAFRLHVTAICYAAKDYTDGLILVEDLDEMPAVRQVEKRIVELVAARLWEPVDGGWVVHDYLEYNPSRAKVQADRAALRERQRRWAEKREQDRARYDGATPGPAPNASPNASPNALVTPSLTLPRTRPVPVPDPYPSTEVLHVPTSPEPVLTRNGSNSSSSSTSVMRGKAVG